MRNSVALADRGAWQITLSSAQPADEWRLAVDVSCIALRNVEGFIQRIFDLISFVSSILVNFRPPSDTVL